MLTQTDFSDRAADDHTALRSVMVEIADLCQTDWRAAWRRAGDSGLLNAAMPKDLGGLGCSARDYLRAMIQLGEACTDNGFTMGLNSHVWTVQKPLAAFGSAAQQQTYLPDLCGGRSIGAYALTEAASGSDAMALTTRAEAREGGYVLNGSKTYIGMAPVCDLMLVFASTAPERKSWGISVFVVHADDPGVTIGPAQKKLGLGTLPMGPVSFDDCIIPTDRRLGPEGAGARIFQATLDWERAFILAPHVGAMARQLRAAGDFARTRQTFGKPILEHQSVSNRLADMALRLETSRLLLFEAAQRYDTDAPLTEIAAMTNLHISEAFLASSTDAMRTFGGAGYVDGAQPGVDVTDALGGVLYSGTSDVQRQIIARMAVQKRGS